MNHSQDILRYLDQGPCDCAVRVTEHDGQTHYLWLTGASWGEHPKLTGTQHGKGYREPFVLRADRIRRIQKISEEKYRELSGWVGAL